MTLVQIALAVKNVPFEEIVFVQYPVNADPADPNRVVPNKAAADALWAALAANEPIQVTNDPNRGGGVITVDPTTPVEPTTPVTTPDARVHRDTGSVRDGRRASRLDSRNIRRRPDLLRGQPEGQQLMAAARRPRGGGGTTIARHGKLRTRHPLTELLVIFAAVVGVIAVSGTGVAAFSLWDAASAVSEKAVVLDENEVVPPSLGAIEGPVDILVAGTDTCEGQDVALFPRCRNNDSPGERNDVTMLVHITDNPRRVTVVSFPRDMLVPIPACDKPGGGQVSAMSSQMINASYYYGGLACTVKTVEALTGESIEFAAAIRWTGVINMSDAIGGVDVCVAGDINDGNTNLHLTAGDAHAEGRRGAAVPADPPRHRRRIRPRSHLEPAAVHVVDGAQAPVRVGAVESCDALRPRHDRAEPGERRASSC